MLGGEKLDGRFRLLGKQDITFRQNSRNVSRKVVLV